VAIVSNVARWVPETDGERLFMTLYQFVAPLVPDLFASHSWVVSSAGVSELCRLSVSMELTHRCLNAGVALYGANEYASVESLAHRLRMQVGLHLTSDVLIKIAQTSRLASLAYINRKLTKTRIGEIHRSGTKYCCWCGTPTSRKRGTPPHEKATVEHLWPEFLGGTSAPENLTIACEECNSARQHAFTWAWFPAQAINEKLDDHGKLPREIRLALALHRLIKVASGQTAISLSRLSLKDASNLIKPAMPTLTLDAGVRYTFFEILQNAME
jgi:5-methylcytosine-specific restriction endonuclease McrA